ncbi:hypothetical protein ACN2CC_07510 [Mesorhizobium muleiense]|uniref:hypothetical protein n=1 Tax=Mesorhizobium muleiense TaxID=1004279 RepID=UPI003AFB8048
MSAQRLERGKRRFTRVRKSWLKTTLVTTAWAAVRLKASYLHVQFLRLKARRAVKKAILAVPAGRAHHHQTRLSRALNCKQCSATINSYLCPPTLVRVGEGRRLLLFAGRKGRDRPIN